jgi:hypothetical protein
LDGSISFDESPGNKDIGSNLSGKFVSFGFLEDALGVAVATGILSLFVDNGTSFVVAISHGSLSGSHALVGVDSGHSLVDSVTNSSVDEIVVGVVDSDTVKGILGSLLVEYVTVAGSGVSRIVVGVGSSVLKLVS